MRSTVQTNGLVLNIWCFSGEGIPDMLLYLVMWSQKTMVEKLTFVDKLQVCIFSLSLTHYFCNITAFLYFSWNGWTVYRPWGQSYSRPWYDNWCCSGQRCTPWRWSNRCLWVTGMLKLHLSRSCAKYIIKTGNLILLFCFIFSTISGTNYNNC